MNRVAVAALLLALAACATPSDTLCTATRPLVPPDSALAALRALPEARGFREGLAVHNTVWRERCEE